MLNRVEQPDLLLCFFLRSLATLYSSGIDIDDFESFGHLDHLVWHLVSALGFRDFVPGHVIETMSSWIDAMKAYAKQTGKWTVPKKDSPEYEAIRALQMTLPKGSKAEAKVEVKAKVAEAEPAKKKVAKKVQEVHAAPVGTAPAVVDQPAPARSLKRASVEKQEVHAAPVDAAPAVVAQPPAAPIKVAKAEAKPAKIPRARKAVGSKSAKLVSEDKELVFN